MKSLNTEHTPEGFREFINGYQKSRILLTAYELDIFTQLSSGEKSSIQVAKKIKTDPRATDRLMNALCALNFLSKKNQKFSNTDFSQTYLNSKSKDFMYGLMHSVNQWDNWNTLTAAVKEGKSVTRSKNPINKRGTKWLEAFIGAMHYRASKSASKIVSKINLSDIYKVLDLGGGSGAYSMGFVKAKKGIRATVFDLPNIIPITKKYIKKEKFEKQIDTFEGDYLTDDFPKGYDLIFISAVIHINSPEENKKIFSKCYKSLNKGGLIVIQDHIMDEGRTTPFPGAIFALNMLVCTIKGDTYTENEIREWFRKAKFEFTQKIAVENGNSLMIGKKI